jgi:hypothetical protein
VGAVAKLGLRRAQPVTVPAAVSADDALSTAAARFAAKRRTLAETAGRAEALLTEPRHAVPPSHPATLAGALVNAQRRRATPCSERERWTCYERAEYIRAGFLRAGG